MVPVHTRDAGGHPGVPLIFRVTLGTQGEHQYTTSTLLVQSQHQRHFPDAVHVKHSVVLWGIEQRYMHV